MKELNPEQKDKLIGLTKHVVLPLVGVLLVRKYVHIDREGKFGYIQMSKDKGFKLGLADDRGVREMSGQISEDDSIDVNFSSLEDADIPVTLDLFSDVAQEE